MTRQLHKVNFKEIFSDKISTYDVDSSQTLSEFLNNIIPVLSRDLGYDENMLEIVEAGLRTENYPAEYAPSLEHSEVRINSLWGEKLSSVSFYIRRKNHQYSENTDICPICIESAYLIRMYNCTHGICVICNNRCRELSINTCSVCRSN